MRLSVRPAAFLVSVFLLGLSTVMPAPARDGKGKVVAATDLVPRVEEYITARVAANQFSGSVLIAQDGKILISKGYGLANREHDVSNTPQTKFRLGSVTKQFSAMAILLLEKQGKLKVEDPISKYIKDAPEAWKDVTIHHLLSHTGGIPEYTVGAAFRQMWTLPANPSRIMALFKDKPLDFKPGEKFKYSNSGYILVGMIIENASGMTYEDFVRLNIFKPLQMNDSGYDHFGTVLKHRADGYAREFMNLGGVVHAPYFDMSIPFAAGALYSTTEDLLRWDRALETEKLLPREALARMWTPVKNGYGYGWTLEPRFEHKCQSHGGGIPGFRTMIARFPDDKICIIILSNLEGTPVGDISKDLSAICFGEKYDLPKATAAKANAAPKGFRALFNGKDLSGWHGMPHFDPNKLAAMPEADRKTQIEKWTADAKQHWRVDNGELVNDGKGAYLTTDESFGDIELLVEYKTVPKADSGIYLRASPQVQIWDYTKEGGKWERGADKGSGGLFNNSPGAPGKDPLVLADRPFGEWNKFRIVQVGERVTVYLNDKLVVDHARLENFWNRKLPLMKQGPIQLQTHGGEIRWRNMFVRTIPAAEANEILRKHSSAGFMDVFNGKDFTGWDGPVENYEVKDGAMICKPKGKNIYTKEEYSDFVARLEYRLPPAGNNGLALRYPGAGAGQPSYDGMCEIQILDDDNPKYAKLDPRQYNGSAYGMTAAHRGYLRPVGEWNFMEVTVRGPTIVVELNGTRILDTDLSKVTEFKDNRKHPGKDRTSGHFGFAGHNDPVAFRNIQIKRLEKK